MKKENCEPHNLSITTVVTTALPLCHLLKLETVVIEGDEKYTSWLDLQQKGLYIPTRIIKVLLPVGQVKGHDSRFCMCVCGFVCFFIKFRAGHGLHGGCSFQSFAVKKQTFHSHVLVWRKRKFDTQPLSHLAGLCRLLAKRLIFRLRDW